MAIPINSKGRILNPQTKEDYIVVQDDLGNTGGYLVLQSDTADFTTGYDFWVCKDELEEFFHETGWDVEWLERN